jgi:magnesium transporter
LFAITAFLDDQNISDVVDLIQLYPEHEADIINSMSINRAIAVFKNLDFSTQKGLIKELPYSKTTELLNQLPADDRTDFLEELPKPVIRDLIKLLTPEERKITLSLLGYPEDSIGRMMTPDYEYVYKDDTVEEYKLRLHEVEKIIMPFLTNLLKTSDQPVIKWPNRKPILEAQIQKILNLTRG